MKLISNQNQKGQSLIETMVAISVIIIGLFSVFALASFSLSSQGASKTQIIATNLAREGIEVVRNVRDSNWLAIDVGVLLPSDWWKGIDEGYWRAELKIENRTWQLVSGGGENFYRITLDPSSRYLHWLTGENTIFYRKIYIDRIGNNQIKVQSIVDWVERGRSHNITLEDRLYNWE